MNRRGRPPRLVRFGWDELAAFLAVIAAAVAILLVVLGVGGCLADAIPVCRR